MTPEPLESAKRRKLEAELIQVDTFTRSASDCVNNFSIDKDHEFVDLVRVVSDCRSIVLYQLPLETSRSKYRVPPLVLMRFARGGKTVSLSKIFDKLKEVPNVHPILISFNGSGPIPFKRRNGETQAQAILRLIAMELGEYTPEQSRNLVVDRKALDQHLGENVVLLLIDELNNLGASVEGDAAEILREMFLDRSGRYLEPLPGAGKRRNGCDP